MSNFNNFKDCLECCEDFGFDKQITAETCWNEGYRLGRRRWYWGPMWFSSVRGWINTQLSKFKNLITGLLVAGIMALSMPQASPQPHPDNAAPCVIAVLVLVVGGVCIIGIIKCCQILNRLDPPPTNTVPVIPTNSVPTNYPPAWTNPSLARFPLALATTNSIVTVQQSIGQADWADLVTVNLSNRGGEVVLTSGSLCLTSRVVGGQALFFLPPMESNQNPIRFFRLLSTP